MSGDKKLPVSLQLVGLTAAVVFCFSTIGAFNLARALWLHSDTIAALEVSNQIQLYAPLVIFVVVCVASLFTFIALLFYSVRSAALISLSYLVLLLLFVVVQLVSTFMAYLSLPMPQQTLIVWVVVRLVYAAWLIGLLVKVWPNYSVKWTAAASTR